MLHSIIVLVFCAQPNAEVIKLIAHRGGVVDKQRAENNLPAIQEAIHRGYWMLEVDIRESKEGAWLCIMTRTSGVFTAIRAKSLNLIGMRYVD
jgi:hypothetical protein